MARVLSDSCIGYGREGEAVYCPHYDTEYPASGSLCKCKHTSMPWASASVGRYDDCAYGRREFVASLLGLYFAGFQLVVAESAEEAGDLWDEWFKAQVRPPAGLRECSDGLIEARGEKRVQLTYTCREGGVRSAAEWAEELGKGVHTPEGWAVLA